MSNRRL